MITALALAAILGSPVQDKIDFQLGWKQGDKITYTVSTNAPLFGTNATGELVLTVTKVDDKGSTVSASRVEFTSSRNLPMRPIEAGTLRFSKKGRILLEQVGVTSNAAVFFMFLTLPEEAIEVGDAFKVSMNMGGSSAVFDGKFVSLGGSSKSLASFESEGTFVGPGDIKTTVNLKTTFDIANGTFVSCVATFQGGSIVHSFKLKEPAK